MFTETSIGNSMLNQNSSNFILAKSMIKERVVNSIIAIGNPMIDIIVNIDKDTIQKYGLQWGRTIYNNNSTQQFLDDIDKRPIVSYTPGGTIMNTLRVCSWCLNMNENNVGKYKLTMLGAVGNDMYKDKILNSLEESNIEPLLEIRQERTSICGVGIFKKDRCLVPDIQASKNISNEFIETNKEKIFSHDILLIEGYFLKENYELCKFLCEEFNRQNKLVILTLSAVVIVQNIMDKIKEIANMSDMIIGNIEEIEVLAECKNGIFQETYEKVHKMLTPRNRILIVTCGKHGVYCSKYNYNSKRLELILQCFPNFVKNDEIVDLNGAADAFLGGFLAMYIKGTSDNKLYSCCRIGNDVASVILRNVGCTFPSNLRLNFNVQ